MRGPLYPLVYGYNFTVSSIPSMTGKVVIVTGGNAGIGYETSKELYRTGAKVYIACRSQERAQDAISRIKRTVKPSTQTGKINFLQLDLMDFKSVQACARQFRDQEQQLDVLVNNAGIMAVDYKLTKDGCDQQLQVNHLGPFLLTHLLLPLLNKSSSPRIVNISSEAHQRFFKETPDSFKSFEIVNAEQDGAWARYGQSKLANVLFTMSLAAKHPNILTNACHPGNIDSGLYDHLGALRVVMKIGSALGSFLKPPEGALTQLYLASSKEISEQKISGRYYLPIAKEGKTSSAANTKNADRLWELSESFFASRNISLSA